MTARDAIALLALQQQKSLYVLLAETRIEPILGPSILATQEGENNQRNQNSDNYGGTRSADSWSLVAHCVTLSSSAERQAMRRRPNGQVYEPLTLPAFA